jgi:hypothetical protein
LILLLRFSLAAFAAVFVSLLSTTFALIASASTTVATKPFLFSTKT